MRGVSLESVWQRFGVCLGFVWQRAGSNWDPFRNGWGQLRVRLATFGVRFRLKRRLFLKARRTSFENIFSNLNIFLKFEQICSNGSTDWQCLKSVWYTLGDVWGLRGVRFATHGNPFGSA